jgi:peptide/nickel transport system substrate-binding protein
LELHSAPTAEMVMVYFNELITDTLPFNQTGVRQALAYGLDRQAIVDEVVMGQAILPQTPLLPGTWAYATEGVRTYDYNAQRASILLDEAGWHRRPPVTMTLINDDTQLPFAFTLMAANEQPDLAVAQAIADQWAWFGISVTVEGVPPLALGGVLESRTYEAALARLVVPGDPDPYPFWHQMQALPGQGQNYTGFEHRRVSEIIEQARITVNPEERLRLYHEFQQLFMEEVPAIPLYVPVYTYALDTRVNGEQLGPLMRPGDRFHTIADWYVLQRRVVASVEQAE